MGMKLLIFNQILLFLICSILIISHTHAQPVEPTRELIPKSKVDYIKTLDLPFQPKEEDDDTLLFNEIDEDTVDDLQDKKKEDIDWSIIPYIPSKYPDLSPAPDPDI